MKRLYVTHKTNYSFEAGPLSGLQQIKKTPYSDSCQMVSDWALSLKGAKEELSFIDSFNNNVHLIRIEPRTKCLVIECEGHVEVTDNFGIRGYETSAIPLWVWTEQTNITKPGSTIRKLVKGLSLRDNISDFHKLMELINRSLDFEKNITDFTTTAEAAFKSGYGVCQDFTNILIQLCRIAEIPTRYVSGYVFAAGRFRGASATHAWVEVYIPNYGWLGLDPTNNCIADIYHIRLAVGRNYGDCSPVKGVYKGNETQIMKVNVVLDTKKIKSKDEVIFENSSSSTLSKEEDNSSNSFQKHLQMMQQQQ